MSLGTRLKALRSTKKITQSELGKMLGVEKSTISMYENDNSSPNNELLVQIARIYGVSTDFLLGKEISLPKIKPVKIPVLGSIVAGVPLEAIEEVLDYEEISPDLAATGDFFALKVEGKSMEPALYEGDVVIVKKQPDVESGQMAIVLVNGDEATVKQVKKDDHGITLIGYNIAVYTPTFYDNKAVATLPIEIIGRVIESRRKY